MVYVMLSRACAISQIYILDDFDKAKMYPDMRALEELERLDKISLNTNKTEWEIYDRSALKVSALNCRSLNKHFPDILTDELLLKSHIIALQETWLEDDYRNDNFNIPGYDLYLNSQGRGKGLATYIKSSIFKHHSDKKQEFIQLSKFTSYNLNVITIYRSQQCDLKTMNILIKDMVEDEKPHLLVGDFNFCYLDASANSTCQYLQKSNFKQLIEEPTHMEGNLLDQAYLRDIKRKLNYTVMIHSKYYTDHKGLAIIIKKGNYKVFFFVLICITFSQEMMQGQGKEHNNLEI